MCIVMEVLSNFSAGCTDKIAPSSSEGLGIVEMALSFDKQYFSYHEVVTEEQGICASVILLNNRISQLSLLIIMQCLLHCSALTKTERLCLLYMPEAFVPLCAFLLPLCSRKDFISQLFINIQIRHDSPISFQIILSAFEQASRDMAYACIVRCLFLYNLKYVKLRMVSHLVMPVWQIFSEWEFARDFYC